MHFKLFTRHLVTALQWWNILGVNLLEFRDLFFIFVSQQELVVALSHHVVQYETNFCTVALQFMEEEKNYALPSPAAPGTLSPSLEVQHFRSWFCELSFLTGNWGKKSYFRLPFSWIVLVYLRSKSDKNPNSVGKQDKKIKFNLFEMLELP